MVEITVLDASGRGRPAPVPCRITVVNDQGALMTTGTVSGDRLAIRPEAWRACQIARGEAK